MLIFKASFSEISLLLLLVVSLLEGVKAGVEDRTFMNEGNPCIFSSPSKHCMRFWGEIPLSAHGVGCGVGSCSGGFSLPSFVGLLVGPFPLTAVELGVRTFELPSCGVLSRFEAGEADCFPPVFDI